jgi:hypothetical protein
MNISHHPTGLTVEVVGIETSTNGRSCHMHDVCGSLIEEDTVLRIRKVQIVNVFGKEETVLTVYHVSDGIDQCHVGCHFVLHALTFDGALAHMTEVYSITSDSPINQKKCRHNMGCCLASLISDFPPTGRKIDKATKNFLSTLSKGEEDSAEEMTLPTRLLGSEQEGFVSYDDPGATNDIVMERYKNQALFIPGQNSSRCPR